MKRRTFLTTAAAATLVSAAGCTNALSDDSGSERDLPAYHTWLPAAEPENGSLFIHIDLGELRKMSNSQTAEDNETPNQALPSDATDAGNALASPALEGMAYGLMGVLIGISPYGDVGSLMESKLGEESLSDETAGVDSVAIINNTLLFEGDLNRTAIEEAASNFKEAGSEGDFTFYEGTGDNEDTDTNELVFALSDDAAIFYTANGDNEDETTGSDAIGTVIAARDGDADRFNDTEDHDWALRQAGHGEYVLGASLSNTEVTGEEMPTGGESENETSEAMQLIWELIEDSSAFVDSIDFAVEDNEITTSLAAVYEDGDTPSEDEITTHFGEIADERTIEVDETKVYISGTWTDADL